MTEPPTYDGSLLGADAPFASGAAAYWDALPQLEEKFPRIYVQFRPGGAGPESSFLALLDTGAHYCILNAHVASQIEDELTDCLGEMCLRTAHGSVRGSLYAHTIELIAEAGENLSIPSTLFISPEWRASSFLGYTGALERLRFALDPQVNRFYFGSVY